MTEHIKEPWQYERIPSAFNPKLDGFQIIAATPDGIDVMTVTLCTVDEADEQNARRIVACVNICEGMDTELLEAGVSAMKSTVWTRMATGRLRQQRDELLIIAECAAFEPCISDDECGCCLSCQAREVLAKAGAGGTAEEK